MDKLYYYKNNPIVKSIFIKMLAPTILMNLTTALASFADTVIIGYFLDELSLSVVTYATPIYMIINTFASLFAVGGSIAMSIDSGKGEKQTSNKAFSISVELLVFIGVILLVAGVFFGKTITHWLGAGKDVYDMVYDYSGIILIFAPVFMLNVGFAFFVRNDGRPILSMVGMFLSIIVNIVSDVIFIGVFDWGVKGAAYATVLGQLVSVLIISSHFLSKKNTLKFIFTYNKTALRIIKNGISTALHFIYQFLTILILNHFISKLAGSNGVVVYTVVFNLYTVSLALFEGISQTIQPIVSLYFGEKSYGKIRNTLRLALVAIVVICGMITVALEIVPQIVPLIFGIKDVWLLEKSIVAVRIFATSMLIMTINVVLGYYLQSTEHSIMSAILVSLRCFVLFLGCALVLGKMFGMNGVWLAYTIAEILTFVIFIIMNKIMRRKILKSGTDVNMFLLDKNIENNIYCLTFNCGKDDFDDFKSAVLAYLEECEHINDSVKKDTENYLLELYKCYSSKKGKYIEVEVNNADQKVIIRDNLNHLTIKDGIQEIISGMNKAEYGPVLGFNRICIE